MNSMLKNKTHWHRNSEWGEKRRRSRHKIPVDLLERRAHRAILRGAEPVDAKQTILTTVDGAGIKTETLTNRNGGAEFRITVMWWTAPAYGI